MENKKNISEHSVIYWENFKKIVNKNLKRTLPIGQYRFSIAQFSSYSNKCSANTGCSIKKNMYLAFRSHLKRNVLALLFLTSSRHAKLERNSW